MSTGTETGYWLVWAARDQKLCGLNGCSGSLFDWSVLDRNELLLPGCPRASHFPQTATGPWVSLFG